MIHRDCYKLYLRIREIDDDIKHQQNRIDITDLMIDTYVAAALL